MYKKLITIFIFMVTLGAYKTLHPFQPCQSLLSATSTIAHDNQLTIADDNNLLNLIAHTRTQFVIWTYLALQMDDQREQSEEFCSWLSAMKADGKKDPNKIIYACDLYWFLRLFDNLEENIKTSESEFKLLSEIQWYLTSIAVTIEPYAIISSDDEIFINAVIKIIMDNSYMARERMHVTIGRLIQINYRILVSMLTILNTYPEKIKNSDIPDLFPQDTMRCDRCGKYGLLCSPIKIQKFYQSFSQQPEQNFFDRCQCDRQTVHKKLWFKLWRRESFLFSYLHTDFKHINCQLLYQALRALKEPHESVAKYRNVLEIYNSIEMIDDELSEDL